MTGVSSIALSISQNNFQKDKVSPTRDMVATGSLDIEILDNWSPFYKHGLTLITYSINN